MSWSVFPYQTSPVHGKNHGQVLQGHIMYNLIIGSLQEGRINSHNRPQARPGHTCGQSNRMLFTDSDVKKALRILPGKLS